MASILRKPIIVCYKPADLKVVKVNPEERKAVLAELVKIGVISAAVQKTIDIKTGDLVRAK